ncbi:MAG: hypothetical protein MJE66_24315 [Proteobacteria bacterium]|nr:hypothetical protein [Pseudomonadota bacterium]
MLAPENSSQPGSVPLSTARVASLRLLAAFLVANDRPRLARADILDARWVERLQSCELVFQLVVAVRSSTDARRAFDQELARRLGHAPPPTQGALAKRWLSHGRHCRGHELVRFLWWVARAAGPIHRRLEDRVLMRATQGDSNLWQGVDVPFAPPPRANI